MSCSCGDGRLEGSSDHIVTEGKGKWALLPWLLGDIRRQKKLSGALNLNTIVPGCFLS